MIDTCQILYVRTIYWFPQKVTLGYLFVCFVLFLCSHTSPLNMFQSFLQETFCMATINKCLNLAGCTVEYGLLNWPITPRVLTERYNNVNYDLFIKIRLVFSDCYFPGNLTNRHREIFHRNPLFVGMKLPEVKEVEPIEKRFHRVSSAAMDILKVSLMNQALFLEVLFAWWQI